MPFFIVPVNAEVATASAGRYRLSLAILLPWSVTL